MKAVRQVYFLFTFLFLFFPLIFLGAEDTSDCQKGHFALPVSQQIAPLFSFGQYIIDKNDVQFYLYEKVVQGENRTLEIDINPTILWGITDSLSLFFTLPFTPLNRVDHLESSGLEDLIIQLEYAYWSKQTCDSLDQATLVGDISFPTGSATKDPATGFGSIAYFLGGTYFHMTVEWYAFTSYGYQITTSHDQTKFGNQFLYQFGFAWNIPTSKKWIVDLMLEIDGQYIWKNRINGQIDPNSGGNIIYILPSLWLSSSRWVFQFGGGVPIVQHLFGKQPKIKYLLGLDIAMTF